MGSFVKKVKKAVKKVKKIVKKNPITKVVKKVAKGIKGLAKDAWKGIEKFGKSAITKFAKFSNKIGPIGMMAMSFAMPWLLGGLSGIASTAWGNLGSFLMPGGMAPGFTSGLTGAMKTLGSYAYRGAQFVGSTYKGITQTLSKTIGSFGKGNFAEGWGNFLGGTKDVLTGKAGMGTQKFVSQTVLTGARGAPGTVAQQVFKSAATIPGQSGLVAGASGVVQTGGVNAAVANAANAQSYKILNAAWNKTGIYNQMTADAQKYHNTIKQQYKLDDYSAHQYTKNNGMVSVEQVAGPGKVSTVYDIDYATSGDFAFNPGDAPGAPGGYSYTGAKAKLTSAKGGVSDVSMFNTGSYTNVGDVPVFDSSAVESGSSLLDKGKTKALDYASSYLAASADEEQYAYGQTGYGDASLNAFNSSYGDTKGSYNKSGALLTKTLADGFERQQLDLRGNQDYRLA
jgi:Txe/YoeB family toxin of Txe-Axe toxin-antitoxin module|tara:strand:+ start:228 stop:1589 length:1362 start_codon:yes stop_codon:yes gene_type:complete